MRVRVRYEIDKTEHDYKTVNKRSQSSRRPSWVMAENQINSWIPPRSQTGGYLHLLPSPLTFFQFIGLGQHHYNLPPPDLKLLDYFQLCRPRQAAAVQKQDHGPEYGPVFQVGGN